MAIAGVVVPPAFGAVGLRFLFGPPDAWAGAIRPAWLGPWLVWGAWFSVALTATAPLVAFATASALSRVDPAWENAARLAGASRARIWRQLVWPVVRPEVLARALAAVFTLSLLEPGAPLVLGLRRTLGYQVAESALDPGVGRLSRAVLLALGATILAAVARVLIAWWGGSETPLPPRAESPPARSARASWRLASVFILIMVFAVVATWLPVLGLVFASFEPSSAAAAGFLAEAGRLRGGFCRPADSRLPRELGRARALRDYPRPPAGPLPGLLGGHGNRAALHRPGCRGRRGVPAARPRGRALAIPQVLGMIGGGRAAVFGRVSSRRAVGLARRRLRPRPQPVGLAGSGGGPGEAPAAGPVGRLARRGLKTERLEAAITLGASPRRANKTLEGHWLGVSPVAAVMTFCLAATNLTPALVLAPTAESRPVSPAVLTLIDQPGGGRTRAAALATMALGANFAALSLVARKRSNGFLGSFRG